MRKATIITGLAVAMASLHTSAEISSTTAFGTWNLDVPAMPAYEYRSADKPLTGAARFSAGASAETVTLNEEDFRAPPRFQHSFEQSPEANAAGMEQGFGPGPELVAPTPTQFLRLGPR
jgi:hypothetical protein